MPKFLVEVWRDGCNSEELMEAVCEELIRNRLDFLTLNVRIVKLPKKFILIDPSNYHDVGEFYRDQEEE